MHHEECEGLNSYKILKSIYSVPLYFDVGVYTKADYTGRLDVFIAFSASRVTINIKYISYSVLTS
jgi:hypothetical protein